MDVPCILQGKFLAGNHVIDNQTGRLARTRRATQKPVRLGRSMEQRLFRVGRIDLVEINDEAIRAGHYRPIATTVAPGSDAILRRTNLAEHLNCWAVVPAIVTAVPSTL